MQLVDEPACILLSRYLHAWEGVVVEKDRNTSILELLQATALERTIRTGVVYPKFTDELSESSPRVEFCLAIDEILNNPISELQLLVEGNVLTE